MTKNEVKLKLIDQNAIIVADYIECCEALAEMTGRNPFSDMTEHDLAVSFQEFVKDEYLTKVEVI